MAANRKLGQLRLLYLAGDLLQKKTGSVSTGCCTSPGISWKEDWICQHRLLHLAGNLLKTRLDLSAQVVGPRRESLENKTGSVSTGCCTSPGTSWKQDWICQHRLLYLAGNLLKTRLNLSAQVVGPRRESLENKTESVSTGCCTAREPLENKTGSVSTGCCTSPGISWKQDWICQHRLLYLAGNLLKRRLDLSSYLQKRSSRKKLKEGKIQIMSLRRFRHNEVYLNSITVTKEWQYRYTQNWITQRVLIFDRPVWKRRWQL